MTTSEVPSTDQVGQFTQTCPACDGTMPAEAVRVGKWRPIPSRSMGLRRRVSMECPYCGYRQRRLEIVPRAFFLTERELTELLTADRR